MEKNRQLMEKARQLSGTKQGRILVFTGARQVGKTTLVKRLKPDSAYLSIEDPILRKDYASLTASQWNAFYPDAILDEVQKEPSLIESIKATYDQYAGTRYALLGSSQILLLKQVKESLAGRCTILDMYPLTLPELQTSSFEDQVQLSPWQQLLRQPDMPVPFVPSLNMAKRMSDIRQAWNFYLQFGGYPALVDEQMSDEDRYLWLKNYVRTYLERDIQDLAMMRDLEPFVKLQQAIAYQTAQTINLSRLATDVQVSAKTVQRYVEYLNISYQTLTLPSWTRNMTKRLTRAPKIHYMDYGVLQAVIGKRGGMTGAEFESLVVTELYKQAKNIQADATFYHLRTHDGKEVDLLVELPQGYVAFEIKQSAHVARTDARHLVGLQQMLDKPLLHSFVLSNDVQTALLADGITAVHAALLLG